MPRTFDTKEEFEEAYPNVRGAGIGPNGELIVLVAQKVAESDLASDEIIPDQVTIDGETRETDLHDLKGVPHLTSASEAVEWYATAPEDHRRRYRPIPGGVSIGNDSIGAGTMGSPLLETEDGSPVTLTNAHVAGEAYEQFQPAGMDGGAEAEPIGTLREASDLDPSEPQTTDSALIDVDREEIDETILGIGPLDEFGEADFTYDTYTKAGRTTGVTEASLRAVDTSVRVTYGEQTIRFTGCDVYGDMSGPGDSGSLIGYTNGVDGLIATSLLFAGSSQATIGIPLPSVFDYHGDLTIPSDEDEGDEEDDTGNGNGGNGSDDGSDDSSGDGSDDGSNDDSDDDNEDETPPEWSQFRHDASIIRVIDGDTMDFETHHGPLNLRSNYRIRLLEIDTAERGHEDFHAHKEFAEQWFTEGVENYSAEDDPADPDEKYPFILDTYRDELDSFGRLLTRVIRKSDGADLTEDLLDEFGEVVRYDLEEQIERLLPARGKGRPRSD